MKLTAKQRKLLFIGVPAVLILALVIMALAGVFAGLRDQSTITFERPFIKTSHTDKTPQTLAELLNTAQPSLDVLLQENRLQKELLAANQLTDAVNSRLSLYGLRTLRDEAIKLIADREVQADLWSDPTGTGSSYIQLAAASADNLPGLTTRMDQLLAKETPAIGLLEPQLDLRGVWSRDEKALLRWMPQGTWIPDQGYSLYRIINGQSELIASQIGTAEFRLDNLKPGAEYADLLTETFGLATLDSSKLNQLGLADTIAFQKLAYSGGTLNRQRARVSGQIDFDYLSTQLLTVPGTLLEKLPATDAAQQVTLQIGKLQNPVSYAFSSDKILNMAAMTVIPLPVVRPYEKLAASQSALMTEILESRQGILAKAFTDLAFAEDAGLGWVDDLASLNLAEGTVITYRLEAGDGLKATLDLTAGQETLASQPLGLAGYGVDNRVDLRWLAPTLETDKRMIAGYWIERKKSGENSFKRLNAVPVAISYSLDETGVFFETPSFYQDLELKNGDSAVYRVQTLDIFGRTSEFSEELAVKVYKVTPPSIPSTDQPLLSSDAKTRADAFYQQIVEKNNNVNGIILPVTRTSDDTALFVIYRAAALGAGHFGEPAEIGRVALSQQTNVAVRPGRYTQIINPKNSASVDLAFFDGDVQPGYSYKYWVAAIDNWGNESAWSTARVMGQPMTVNPADPTGLTAELLRNDLPDLSLAAPGFGVNIIDNVTLADIIGSGKPATPRLGVSDVILQAKANKIEFAKAGLAADTISALFSNLPNADDIHTIVAISNEELRPDKTALVSWPAYSGSGLAGYNVYRATAPATAVAELQALSKPEVLARYAWQLIKASHTTNQIVDITLTPQADQVYLYLICLVPENRPGSSLDLSDYDLAGALQATVPGGWVRLNWQKPADPQVRTYKVYRAEVENFKQDQNIADLSWNLVGESSDYTSYTEKVDQTYAHYYYYRVSSVDVWGLESAGTAPLAFRVPATSPPQTPAMLVPLAQKGQIQVNWAGVAHADKYILYRTTLPKISEDDLFDLQVNRTAVFNRIFKDTSADDLFVIKRFNSFGNRVLTPEASTPVLSIDKFNTLQQVDPLKLQAAIAQISTADKLDLFQKIADKYGPLALRNYSQLSEAAANLVIWDKIAEIPAGSISDPLGAYSYLDQDVRFGDSYYYTVQAVNDDNLASARPQPVMSSPRKNGPFEPVTGLAGKIDDGRPVLTWNQAKDANLSWVESREYVAGYIVYRSTAENGDYYQASPLLPELTWRDEFADPGAYNWYRVKVVDTAGYLSEFSPPVLVRSQPQFEIITRLQPITFDALPLPSRSVIVPITPRITPGLQIYKEYQKLTLGSYTISNVQLLFLSGVGNGTGYMTFGQDEYFKVDLTDVYLGSITGVDPAVESRILRGSVSLSETVYLPKCGVTFTSLNLTAGDPAAAASGYLQAPSADGSPVSQNLMGDLYALSFSNSTITSGGRIDVDTVPGFRYGQLVIAPSRSGVAFLNPSKRQPARVTIAEGTAEYHLDLETLDNSGFEYKYGLLSFDPAGQMSGKLTLGKDQTLRLVIPAGLGLKASSSTLVYEQGSVSAAASSIKGKILLPFTTFDDTYVPPASMIRPNLNDSAALAGFDRFLPDGIVAETPSRDSIIQSMTPTEIADLDSAITYFAERVQSTSLLIMPTSASLIARLSTVDLDIAAWDGHGMAMNQTSMTPANVGNAGADTSAALGVTPGRVALDLDRLSAVNMQGAPAETGENFWLGIIVKEGRLALPAEYIKQDNGQRIAFGLTAGELIYDLNGFSYQNLIYNPEGTPADFGPKLGNFRDVKIFDCTLDLYGNRVNLEMNGELGIPLFNFEKGKIKLYTNKDGDFICTMAQTPAIDAAGTGEVKVTIQGGQLMPDGLHVNGLLDINLADSLVLSGVAFNELIIPADMAMLTESGNADQHYGIALLDQPQTVKFHDFPTEIRALSFVAEKKLLQVSLMKPAFVNGLKRTLSLGGTPLTGATLEVYQSSLTLWGGLQLSDNIALNVEDDFDRIVIGEAMSAPAVNYETSVAKLDFEFEEYVKIDGVVKPVPGTTDKGYVEYTAVGDGIDMAFNTICDLAGYSVHSKTRFGYDYENERYFFALGSYYDDPDGISFYYGKMKNINGVIGYNVDLPKTADGRFAIPKGKSALFDSVSSMAVDRTPGGNYFFASTVLLEFGISYQDATIKIVEVRDCYIVVEKGPSLESGGDLYTPLDIEELVTEGNFSYTGYTRLGYYHPQRLFQFDSVIEEMQTYSLTVSGSVGCEMNPVFWEVRIGYPDALEAKLSGLAEAGFGIMFRSSDIPDDSYIKARIYFNFDAEANISIVYVRAYLHAGAEGLYEFDTKRFVLDVWVEGGVEGGIKVKGKRYNIIHVMMGANGQIIGQVGQNWQLSANARIYYSLDLWITEIDGSVNWHIAKSF
ncbi:MAG TPA: hypothetical protein DCM45_05350 [Clostridiales bacterium]|nr:hypothetical protein [Clostridiales bacterium]